MRRRPNPNPRRSSARFFGVLRPRRFSRRCFALRRVCNSARSRALYDVPTYRPCCAVICIMTPYIPPGSSSPSPRPDHHPDEAGAGVAVLGGGGDPPSQWRRGRRAPPTSRDPSGASPRWFASGWPPRSSSRRRPRARVGPGGGRRDGRGVWGGESRGHAPGDEEREHLGGKGADVDVCQLASEGAGTRGRRRSLGAGARDVEARGYSGDVVTGEAGGSGGRADGRGGARCSAAQSPTAARRKSGVARVAPRERRGSDPRRRRGRRWPAIGPSP